jgi:hypothetical protein
VAQTVKITPASGLLEFIGNTTSNKPYLQHDDNGNLTLTLQATKKFTVAGNLKVNGKVTMAQQTLTDGAAVAWDFNSGANAKVTLAGARTLVISNMETGDTGLILVKQDAVGGRTLTLPGGSTIVGGGTYTASSAANATDVLGVYYDGTTYWWTIGYNTVTPPLTSVGITGSDFVIANSPLTSNGTIGLALATVNSNVGTFGSASAVPVITVNAKGLITAVSATNISIPTNLDSLTDVTISSAVNGQLLQFNGSQWVNWTPNYLTGITSGQVTTALGYTPVPNTRNLTINGVTQNLTADRTWTIDTVNYVSRVQHGVKAGVAINKGQAVYVTSADGTNMIVGLASNGSEATSSKTMGLLDATVATNGMANVVTEGLLAGLDTSLAGTEGDPVWLGDNGNLIYGLLNKPYAPRHLVFIGIVTRKNANNGEIFVKVQNGFELKEIHDVDLITTVPVNGHILGYDGTLWVNKTIAGWLGFTPANDANVVHTSGNETISGIKTFSGTTQATSTTTGTIVTAGGVGIAKNLYVGGNINVVGNLIIGGTTTTVNAQNLSVSDNMIYLNNGVQTTITNAVGNGSTVVYTTEETHNYIAGMSVTITGVTPSAYNLSNQTITAVSTNSFTIANSATGSYSSGGTARAKSNANPDLGFAAGYNDGSYAHAGLFRDATDNVWKFFKGYVPEPDASPFIDTSHASFAYADLRANDITGRSFIKDGGTSSQFLKADGSVDSSTYLTTGTAGTTYQPLDADLTAIAALATTGFLKRTGANTWALDSNTYLTGITSADVINALGYTPVTNARTITINGVTYDLSANRSWTITAGVSSVSAGTGISVNTTTGAVTVTNTGLLSGTAGSGISVSTSSGNLNIVNTGLLSGTAGSGISVSTSSGNLNIVNTGLLSGTAGSGISVSTASGNLNIVNTGLLSATAGAGISVSTSSGNLNIVNTITNLNQLTNGPGYITGITSGMVTAALGYTPWHAGNDGAGSGLDADLLDGLSSGSFLRSDDEVNYTNNIFRIYTQQGATGDTVGSATTLQIYQADVNRDAFQTFHISGDYAVHFGLDGSTNDLFVGGWSMGPVKYRIWHEGNLTNLNQLTNGPGYITSASLSGYATQTYVTTQINNLINGAPGALNTLDELAAALGDDANFATTVTNSIAGKVSKSGDTMTGNLSFGTTSGLGLSWGLNTDAAFIRFVSTGNQAGGSYLEIGTQDDLDEEIKFTQSGNIRFYLATDGRLKTGSGYNYVWEDGTWGISVTGNAGTVTNGVYTTGSYANPAWITSLAWSKITGAPAFITSYTETDTLASVTGRGATTSTTLTLAKAITTGLYGPSTSGNIAIWQYDASNTGYGIVYNEGSPDTLRIDVSGNALTGIPDFLIGGDYAQINGNTVWHAGNLTNLNQLTNGPGYITSSGRAYPRRSDGSDINFIWSGQSGQPTWLWGGTDGTNMYVYNPSNFSVNYATSAGSASTAGYADEAKWISFPDGPRDLSDRRPNWNNRSVAWDFVTAGTADGVGNYAGVMTFSPWDGTSGSTGDSSYQLAFINETGLNASGIPGLRLRNGIDSAWNSTWYKVWHSGHFSQTNINNWTSAYNDVITSAAVSGTTTKTLTLTQRDGGTVTASWTDIDTDTDQQTLSLSGSTLSISGGNSVTLPSGGISQGTADSLYVNISGDEMTGNLYISPISANPAQIQLAGSNPELYVSAKTGTARVFINRQASGNQATLMFTTGMNVFQGTAWDYTGVPMWSMGMTNNNNTDSFKIAYGDIYEPTSVALEITTANVAYFKYVPYAAGNLLATQSWVQSQGYLTSVSDVWVNTTGDTMTGNLQINARLGISKAPASNESIVVDNPEGTWLIHAFRGATDVGGIHTNSGAIYIQHNGSGEIRLSTQGTATWNGDILATRPWVTSQGYLTSLPSHNHDDRYYTESEVNNFFSGATAITGYNKSNWDAAYNKRPTAISFSGTGTKTLTLTQGDGSTLTATFNDIDTDTNTDGQTLSISGSTLTISGGNSVTLPSGGISQGTADSLYVNVSGDTMTGPLAISGVTSGQELFAVNGVNGRLFTVTDDLTDSLYSVNTLAGLPVLEVFANNIVQIGKFGTNAIYVGQDGRVGFGTTDFSYTAADQTSPTNNRLFVNGSIQLLGANDALVFGRGTATVLRDEKLAFGWGGGWFMEDATYLRVHGNKMVYSGGSARFDDSLYLGGQTYRFYSANSGTWTNGNFGAEGDIYFGTRGTWLSSYLNQALLTSSAPTFTNIYNNSWFRNNNSNEGLYNQVTTQHWSSNTNGYWDASSTTSVSAIRFYTGGHVSSIRGYVYANTSNEIGFLNSGGNWGLRMDNNYNVQVYGQISATNFSGSSSGTNTGDQTNISGNAATATNVAWTGVTGRPTALSQFTNDLGNYGGFLTSLPSHNHDGVYVPINPDGDGPAWSYADNNPTINGKYVGGGQRFGADGDNLTGGFLQSRHLNAYDGHVNSSDGYYVGVIEYGSIPGVYDTTQVIDSSGRWVGVSIADNKIASSSNWNTAYGWGNHAGLYAAASHNHDDRYYTESESDSRFINASGDTMTGRLTLTSISGVDQMVENDYGAYLHLGGWAVGRTDSTAVLVNTAYRADYATDLFNMNISRFTNDSAYITSSGRAYPRNASGGDINFYWSGQSGQPTWLWGGTDGTNMYVYNPSNFSVNYAASAGSVAWTNVSGRPTALSQFTNDLGLGGAAVTIQDSPPAGAAGKLWWESDTGKLKVYYGSAWVDATPVPDMSLYYSKAGGSINGDVTVRQTLTVVGNTLIQGVLTETSDISLKENILPLENSLDKIMKLNGVSFNKKTTPNMKEVGFIAQEVEAIIPDLVTETGEGIKTVSYSRVTAVLVETIKEQQAQINALTDMVNSLTKKLDNL